MGRNAGERGVGERGEWAGERGGVGRQGEESERFLGNREPFGPVSCLILLTDR